MKSIIFTTVWCILFIIIFTFSEVQSKKSKSKHNNDDDEFEEKHKKVEEDSNEDEHGVDEPIEKEKTPAKNLTFMVTAKNLGPKPPRINPYVSIFYETKSSDLNTLSSEVVSGSINPIWNKVFWFIWNKGTEQKIRFKVKSQIKKQSEQLLGEATLIVDEYVQNGEKIELKLKGGKGIVKIEKTIPISFRLSARGLARKDTFNTKSDPYVICYWRQGPDGNDVIFAKTSHINNVEDADWIDIITFDAYQPGKDQYWNFKVYDDDGFTKDDFLGDGFVKIDPFLEKDDTRSKTVDLSLKGTLTIKLVQ